jgi:hypothetical protein
MAFGVVGHVLHLSGQTDCIIADQTGICLRRFPGGRIFGAIQACQNVNLPDRQPLALMKRDSAFLHSGNYAMCGAAFV